MSKKVHHSKNDNCKTKGTAASLNRLPYQYPDTMRQILEEMKYTQSKK